LQEQIFAKAADVEEPGALGHDVLGLDAMGLNKELDKDPDAMESDAGLEVLCRNLLVWELFS
jgi:hypothetical protein